MTRVNKMPRHRQQQLPVGYLEILFGIERLDVAPLADSNIENSHVRARWPPEQRAITGLGTACITRPSSSRSGGLYSMIARREISFEAESEAQNVVPQPGVCGIQTFAESPPSTGPYQSSRWLKRHIHRRKTQQGPAARDTYPRCFRTHYTASIYIDSHFAVLRRTFS